MPFNDVEYVLQLKIFWIISAPNAHFNETETLSRFEFDFNAMKECLKVYQVSKRSFNGLDTENLLRETA